jgi:hypothetical protein
MTKVRLPSGHVVLLDDADLLLLAGYQWHADRRGHTTYVRGRRPGAQKGGIYLHNLIMGGMADHRNGNGLDNRRENLRPCTQAQNTLNSRKKRERKRFKGVYFDGRRGRWWAQLYIGRVAHFGGYHDTEEAAARAYDQLAREHHREFARLNAWNEEAA